MKWCLFESPNGSYKFQFFLPEGLTGFANLLHEEFLQSFEDGVLSEPHSTFQFLAQFLRFITGRKAAKLDAPTREVFLVALEQFEHDYLRGENIHTCVAAMPDAEPASKREIIRSYYESMQLMEHPFGAAPPPIFSEDNSTFFVFGGQGNTQQYFDELRDLYGTYGCLLDEALDFASEIFEKVLGDETTVDQYPHGLDFLSWLRKPETTPERDYLLSAPVSFPLIAVLQLASFYVKCKLWQLNPGEVVQKLHGLTGHSQGIIVAVALATCETFEDFQGASKSVLIALFYTGCRSQQAFPGKTSWQKMVEERSEDDPTPMMNILHLPRAEVESQIRSFNQNVAWDQEVYMALVNGPSNIVVGGAPESLRNFTAFIQKLREPTSKTQPQSGKFFTTRYLPISCPFHTPYLTEAALAVEGDMKKYNISIMPRHLLVPVYDSKTGRDLREAEEEALLPMLTRAITTEVVDWPLATKFPNRSYIIDFGPGGTSGVGTLMHRMKEGRGTRIILAGPLQGALAHVGYKAELFESSETFEKKTVDWLRDFAPSLLSDASGKTIVSTKMSQLLGAPPVMVAGMTPTTVHPDFVAAVINAGYHVELAAGGHPNERSLIKAITTIEKSIRTGKGITINLIYSAPRAIQWQIPLIKSLVQKGHLIEGITLGAGVPSLEIATGYIEDLGLKHIGFKPGSADAIQQVLTIAKAHPTFPILLQWTGGRGGGHHSAEDFHAPMLQTYSSIRRCTNIILIAGSGFGGSDDTYPYLTGSWSEKFEQSRMPFDGCLFGSRMMVAKEAHTSLAAKQAIAATEGVEDAFWRSGKGIITVQSEMGQPIHKIATRGVQLWAEMDKKIFSLEKSKQLAVIKRQRSYIIERLNKDFQKVWFGYDFDAGKAGELKDMSYSDVARRMVDLLYLKKSSQWIDDSYIRILGDFIRRIEERLPLSRSELSKPIFQSYDDFNDPVKAMRNLVEAYGESKTQLISQEDQEYFLSICRRSGQKPVTFIPVLDANFESWFKKDSLWQSENVEAVIDGDIQRCCILQGPVSVTYATPENIDQSAKSILDQISSAHVQSMLEEFYNGDQQAIPVAEFFGHQASEATVEDGIQILPAPGFTAYSIPFNAQNIPSSEAWFNILAGKELSWRYAVFKSPTITSGDEVIPNPIRQAFKPLKGCSVLITNGSGRGDISITMSSNNDGQTDASIVTSESGKITLRMLCYENALNEPLPLEFYFGYHPELPHSLLREDVEGREERIRSFYDMLWFGKGDEAITKEVIITKGLVEKFLQTIGGGMRGLDRDSLVPMDLAIVIGWKAIMKSLLFVKGDLLKLVHLSNEYRVYPGAGPLMIGDKTESSAKTTAIIVQETGKVVSVCCTITRDGAPVMDVISEFFYRGTYTDRSDEFQNIKEEIREVELSTNSHVNLLMSKAWMSFYHPDTTETLCGKTLSFELDTFTSPSHLRTTGKVFARSSSSRDPIEIGIVEYDSLTSGLPHTNGNPVLGYLGRHGKVVQKRVPLDTPNSLNHEESGFIFTAPKSNLAYSRISQDFNPIHVSPAFARYAGLPNCITHGMHTSAIIRSICEMRCAESSEEVHLGSMKRFSASFSGMIQPGDKIEVSIEHVAMLEGLKVITIEARNVDTEEKVFVGECEIEQSETAYIFTGQGSQEMGMGMDLYESSPVARAVWDRADKHFDETYGFRLTDIVKKNPKQLTVHFGGRRGAIIRQNYLKMTYDSYDKAGNKTTKRFFDIHERSASYTYRSPGGLLFSTEFAQPALTVMEKAAFEDMAARGLIAQNSMYAGHSLGEYAALCAIADMMPLEQILSIVFYRGLSMQVAVERDEQGRSEFGMMAVDPSRVTPSFEIKDLEATVSSISKTTGSLLEIVNYNVAQRQYVCAGTLTNLHLLTTVLDTLAASTKAKHDAASISSLIDTHVAEITSGPPVAALARGKATIPLTGIDVPFHSSFLRPNLSAFREVLEANIIANKLDPEKLIGRYVPNVTARPFELTKEAFEYAYAATGSERLKKVLDDWEPEAPVPAIAVGGRLGRLATWTSATDAHTQLGRVRLEGVGGKKSL
ncbi:beta subunit of fatty acid synthase [Lophium mytilinum]|uniref:S-acyl fatty acid synthase thioesterase n=1 Tax=Lophium mytilinum TaxID=390894 RepID=A0A6A6R5N7_9PEZI|nr:beta subunit of fatty acid synthase [Lophium mytilinum]